MREVVDLVKRVSVSPATTVLLTGETGTGKEVIARELHRGSARRNGPFVTINCAALPAQLLEGELFGHERGAFTDAKSARLGYFEEAHGGTLFLDEIGELPLPLQAKLLRALQERVIRRVGGNRDIAVDVRVVAASNVDLVAATEEGRFREDLFFRLSVIPIYVPPLRERKEAILPLVRHFSHLFAKQLKRPVRELSDVEAGALLQYEWPGNVRELRNCVERAVLLEKPFDLGIHTPPPDAPLELEATADALEDTLVLSLENPSLVEAERLLIQQVMARVNGNERQAAEMLGIHWNTLSRKMDSYASNNTCIDEVLSS
jgi:two-component system response regulator HydG